jgi:L-asparagine transporter-like permease
VGVAWVAIDRAERIFARRQGRGRLSRYAEPARQALAWLVLAAFASLIVLAAVDDSEAASVAGAISVLLLVVAAVGLAALVVRDQRRDKLD